MSRLDKIVLAALVSLYACKKTEHVGTKAAPSTRISATTPSATTRLQPSAIASATPERPASSATAPAVAVEQTAFPLAVAKAICDNAAPCCKKYGQPLNATSCREHFKNVVSFLIRPGKNTQYDGSAADRCIAAMKAAVIACKRPSHEWQLSDPSCRAVYRSAKRAAPGERCDSRADCDLSGGFEAICDKNRCRVTKRSKTGGPCLSGQARFGASGKIPAVLFVCESTTHFCHPKTNTCTPRLAAGASGCTSLDSCDARSVCNVSTGKCEQRKGPGESCTDTSECAFAQCRRGRCISALLPVDDVICRQ